MSFIFFSIYCMPYIAYIYMMSEIIASSKLNACSIGPISKVNSVPNTTLHVF